jgi:hypothetical protein
MRETNRLLQVVNANLAEWLVDMERRRIQANQGWLHTADAGVPPPDEMITNLGKILKYGRNLQDHRPTRGETPSFYFTEVTCL